MTQKKDDFSSTLSVLGDVARLIGRVAEEMDYHRRPRTVVVVEERSPLPFLFSPLTYSRRRRRVVEEKYCSLCGDELRLDGSCRNCD